MYFNGLMFLPILYFYRRRVIAPWIVTRRSDYEARHTT
jgi:hypothetical protein